MKTIFTIMSTTLLLRRLFRNLRRLLPVIIIVLGLLFVLNTQALAATPAPLDDDSGIVGGIVGGLLNGLQSLFVPSPDFFDSFRTDIQDAIYDRFCCAIIYFRDITDQFSTLQSDRAINSALMIDIPANQLFYGQQAISGNLIGGLGDFGSWFRGITSAFMVVVTVILCYRKVIAMLRT